MPGSGTSTCPRTTRVSSRPAALADNAFVAADAALLAETLCIEEERVVARDNTVAYDSRRLQLPASQARAHYVKARVKVREYPDGTLAVFHGPRRIAALHRGGRADRRAPDHPERDTVLAAVKDAGRAATGAWPRGHP